MGKSSDGSRALRLTKRSRVAVKDATKAQEKANRVYRKEEKQKFASDQRAEKSISKVMRAKTGITAARKAATTAARVAKQAARKAKRLVRRAQVASLRLRNTIDRSARAVASMDRDIAKSMKTVLPSVTQ